MILQRASVMPLLLQESFGKRGASYVEAAPVRVRC
jgi:hypothetical protein